MRLSRTNVAPALAIAMAVAVCLPSPMSAQTPSLQEVQVSDIETVKDKVVGLAQLFDESQYDWRPTEAVLSVRNVLGWMLAQCLVFPTYWGDESSVRLITTMQLALVLPRAEMINELNLAFDHLISVVREMDNTERTAQSGHSGPPMQVQANISVKMAEMHERLGQLTVYARMNDLVPPWSL